MKTVPRIWLAAVFGITAASIWGGMYVVSDVMLLVLPPFTLLTLRILLALMILSRSTGREGAARPTAGP